MSHSSESAIIGNTELDLGIVPGWGATQRLPESVLFGTPDQREGMTAFVEDREPEFE